MKRFFAVFFAVGMSLAAVSAAQAEGGCGRGWHRGPEGGCRRNGVFVGPAVVVAPGAGVVVTTGGGRACPVGWHLGPYGHCRRNW